MQAELLHANCSQLKAVKHTASRLPSNQLNVVQHTALCLPNNPWLSLTITASHTHNTCQYSPGVTIAILCGLRLLWSLFGIYSSFHWSHVFSIIIGVSLPSKNVIVSYRGWGFIDVAIQCYSSSEKYTRNVKRQVCLFYWIPIKS